MPGTPAVLVRESSIALRGSPSVGTLRHVTGILRAMAGVAAAATLLTVLGCAGTEGPVLRSSAATGAGGASPANIGGIGGEGAGGAGGAPGAWVPQPNISWQIQLFGSIDRSVDAELFAIDIAQTDAIEALSAAGHRVACYFSGGTHEPWRDDLDTVASSAVGNPLAAYPDERWLDLRDPGVQAVMTTRVRTAATTGCAAVVPANLDGFAHDSGFALTSTIAAAFGESLADVAHDSGLSIVASSTRPELAAALEPSFDWVLAVGCLSDSCAAFATFQTNGKPVLVVDFAAADQSASRCDLAAELGLNVIFKESDLGAFRLGCR